MKVLVAAGAYLIAWVAALVVGTVALYAIGYLVSPFGPACPPNRPGTVSVSLPLAAVVAGAPMVATFFVGMWGALAAPTVRRRFARVALVLLATALAGVVGGVLAPMCM